MFCDKVCVWQYYWVNTIDSIVLTIGHAGEDFAKLEHNCQAACFIWIIVLIVQNCYFFAGDKTTRFLSKNKICQKVLLCAVKKNG